ncbi:MAG TPA: hypothetical protein VHT73_18430 [Thermodesulfobacteriota bacterium]|nr:hypothetical protein [Thermodesulfobacteriota bacterium]
MTEEEKFTEEDLAKGPKGAFTWIDVAFGGTDRRNNLIKVSELEEYALRHKRKHGDFTECYKTYFRYTDEMVEHFKKEIKTNGRIVKPKNSVKDFYGSCDSDFIPVDIDCKGTYPRHYKTLKGYYRA